MKYINALQLINVAIENDLLHEENGNIFVYRSGTSENKEGWYITEKDTAAKELMHDEEGQNIIISALKEKNIDFTQTNYS